jgi:hypothetical protein
LTTFDIRAKIEVVYQREHGKMPTFSPVVIRFAQAIAVAEGSNPDWNNPGDLTGLDSGGFPTCGLANSEGVWKFLNKGDGWYALYIKCERMLSGRSKVYPPSMTLEDVGLRYSGGDPHWADNVAAELGCSTTLTLAQIAQL